MATIKVCGIETEYGIHSPGAEQNPISASSVLVNAYASDIEQKINHFHRYFGHGVWAKASSEIETMATIPRIVAIQRRVAAETGCGFFNTFAAMGGAGTMARWYASQPRLVSADFIHPYPAGGKIVATVFVKQIESGLSHYKLRQLHLSSAGGAVR